MTTAVRRRGPNIARPPVPLPPGCDVLLSRDQLGYAIGVSNRRLDAMISSGEFPPADTRVGKLPRWRVATLNGWINARCPKQGG